MSLRGSDKNIKIDKLDLSKHISNTKSAFSKVKEEIEEHLNAINENTDELNMHANHLTQLESKIDKLNEKIEQLQAGLDRLTAKNIVLSHSEQRVFLLLYTSADNFSFNISDLEAKTALCDLEIRQLIASMREKGIAINQNFIDRKIYVSLDVDFKQRQAKENLIELDPILVRTVNEKTLTNFF